MSFKPHIAQLGQGPQTALALHCTLAFSGAWGGFVKAVGPDWRFMAPDMPNHGKSPDWEGDFVAQALAGARAALSEPMHVIGHSFGAVLAMRLAIEHPELVKSATLFEPVFFCIAKADAPESVAEHDAMAAPFYEAFALGDMELAARRFNRMWSPSGPPWDRLPDQLRAAMSRAIPVVPETEDFLFGDSAGLIPRLKDIEAPVLLMQGESSPAIIKATNQGLAARIRGARQVEIAGAGHMAPISHPKEVAREWQRFVAESRP